MAKTNYKPVIEIRQCEYCKGDMPVKKYYEQKRFCSAKCRSLTIPMPPRPDQTGFIPWNKGLNINLDSRIKNMSENRRGEKNWQFVHGNSKAHKSMWQTAIHKEWRKKVFERDDYICQICFSKGGELQADHIKCFAHHPDLRYELSNGRTLCKECHKNTPNFGNHSKERC